MADGTKIEWTDATWNAIVGCSVTSPGCTNCYAMRQAPRTDALSIGAPWAGPAGKLTKASKAGPVWTGAVRLVARRLDEPLRLRRPRRIFVNSMGDLFHENVPDEWIDRVFAVMALAPQHTFQVLTKRAERMHRYMTELVKGPSAGRVSVVEDDGVERPMTGVQFRMTSVMCDLYPNVPPQALNFAAEWADDHYPDGDGFLRCWPLPNVWLGVSVEDQERADERIPPLLATPAAKRFISAEPMLAPIRLRQMLTAAGDGDWLASGLSGERRGLDWVIVGGESGHSARLFNTDWAASIVEQCRSAGVACFVKQLGAHVIQGGERRVKRDKKGGDWSEWPHELRVREFPR
jgi:protein gp37